MGAVSREPKKDIKGGLSFGKTTMADPELRKISHPPHLDFRIQKILDED